MDTVKEDTTDVMAQVTDLLTLCLDLFAADSIGGDDAEDGLAQGLEQYLGQVHSVATAAEALGMMGLHHVCVHYHTLLQPLAGSTALDEDLRLALETWPTLVVMYLDEPTDPDNCLALVEHLQSPTWAQPLADADAQALLHQLLPPDAMPLASVGTVEETPALPPVHLALPIDEPIPEVCMEVPGSDVELALPVSATVVPLSEAVQEDTEHARSVPVWDAEEDAEPVLDSASPTLPEALEAMDVPTLPEAESSAAVEAWAEAPSAADLLDTPCDVAESAPAEVPFEAEKDEDAVCLALDQTPALTSTLEPEEAVALTHTWDEELEVTSDDELEVATDEEGEITTDDELEVTSNDALEVATDEELEVTSNDALEVSTDEEDALEVATDEELEVSTDDVLDATAQTLLDLLCQETSQLAQTLDECLTESAIASDEWRQVLTDHSEEIERFGEGAASMGLEGLPQFSTHLCTNLLHLAAQESPLSHAQRAMVPGWTSLVLEYLNGLHEPTTQAALVAYLADALWPIPFADEDAVLLRQALQHAHLEMEDAEAMPERQREARLDDMTLTVPEDVVPELLSALLQELPQQAADFSAAIQRLSTTAGTLADVTVAQRIAHSLKGAANTVGVPGVANLTHHLEDILVACAQEEMLPTRPLCQTLTSAADCLEAMSEALNGVGEPPPAVDMLRMLQEILDWANLIDAEGVPSDDTTCPAAREVLPGLEDSAGEIMADAASMVPGSVATGSGTRLETDLVDELLRLSGENIILNGQLRNRLKRTTEQTRGVRTQSTTVQQLVWELEQLVDIRGVTSPLLQRTADGEFDPLEMEQYNELHTVSRRLLEAVTDTLAMVHDVEGSLVTLDGFLDDQNRVQRESQDAIMQTRMVPVKTLAPRLQRGVRQTCRLTGKEADFVLRGGDTLVDNAVLSGMLDPLMHMLRNAVDHGIEAPEVREAQGKPRTGTITLQVTREGNTIALRCRDDGAGLDYAAIRRTALARGLINEQMALSEEDMGQLILRPGFSTRSQATQVSGRGIGMDVVNSRIQELKGSLRLSSEPGRGCVVDIRLPVSLMSTHGLLVRSGSQVFAVSDLGVEQILYPAAGTLHQEADTLTYMLHDEALEATTLEAVLNLRAFGSDTSLAGRPALLVRDHMGRRRVVLTQAVLDSLPLVVKPLGRYVPTIPGVIGATILGDGSVTAVLDLPELLRTAVRGQTPEGALQETVDLAEQSLPVALVVDDSLSARRALADFVKDLGFEVHTAGDGLEALASMEKRLPDILLVDLEMPRMNGMELAEHVRVQHTAERLPIIMVTSRSTEKHRRNAERSGVNLYLVKPFSEDTLAEHIHHLLAAKSAAAVSA